MTPFEKTEELRQAIEEYAASVVGTDNEIDLPEKRYSLLAEPVVECESLIVALMNMDPSEAYDPRCGAVQIGTFSVVLARDCANIYDREGNTIVAEATKLAQTQSDDGDFLWRFASEYPAFASKTWNVAFVITGGIAITSMLLTIGID